VNPVVILEGRAVPLDRSDVDTDQIIPSDWLKRVERTGFGRGLFSEWRDEASFVLNQAEYQGASIMLAGPRFGTGSSREHAVWALMDYGFTAIIAPSFGDIFKNNASKQGLVTVQLGEDDVTSLGDLVKADPSTLIVIDVAAQTVEAPEHRWQRSFDIAPMTRERLMNGWDDIGLTLRHVDDITTFEERATTHRRSMLEIFDPQGHVNA
jgi:3-isopropylmalate/(R)-2-methylmalate dehydratase small subunit